MGVDELFKTSSTPITYYQNSIKSLLLQRITQRYQVQKGQFINTHYLLSKLYIVFTFTAYNSKISSIERANHQHPLPNTQHLSAHQHLTLNTFHLNTTLPQTRGGSGYRFQRRGGGRLHGT